jgi:predicted phosphodiesterase
VRYLVVSDIHGNAAALDAVLADAEGHYDSILNCGDLVGYGPDPNYVLDWARASSKALVVRGNHDKACCGLLDLEWFNPVASEAALWTRDELSAENAAYLVGLPQGPTVLDGFQLMHGSPQDEDEYVISSADALMAMPHLERGLGFFGHTHVQGCFELHRNGVRSVVSPVIGLEETSAYLINPGSVGQPRDGDSRAAFALYHADNHLVELKRVGYNIDATALKIAKAELPLSLARRLYVGH